MAKKIVGLDLGAYSVKAVVLEPGRGKEKFKILSQVEELLPHTEESEVSQLERQLAAIMTLKAQGYLEADSYFMALPSSATTVTALNVPFEEARKIEAILPGLLESEIPFSLDDMVTSWCLAHRKNKEDQSRINVSFAKKEAIASVLAVLQPLNIDPRILGLNPVVYYEIVRDGGFGNLLKDGFTIFIDLGHHNTNFLVIDEQGLVMSKTIPKGGEAITNAIALALDIDFFLAQKIKHEEVSAENEDKKLIVSNILKQYKESILHEIKKYIINFKNDNKNVISIFLAGGGSKLSGLKQYLHAGLQEEGIDIFGINEKCEYISDLSMAIPISSALMAFHLHSKDNRFNFRKDEFSWRGRLDFLKAHSTALSLWSLAIICSLVILWATSAMMLEKENRIIEAKAKEACSNILGQKNISVSKCLALIKEQINVGINLGVPVYSATNVFIDLAKYIPKDITLTITEMDILENKLKLKGETSNFEDVDKVVGFLQKIPCFSKVEKNGRVVMKGKNVEFSVQNDIDCQKKESTKP